MSTEVSFPALYTHSENCSSYKMVCNITDTFTSCINIYEALLPYFQKERTSDDHIYKKFLKIDEIISKLNTELTILKTELIPAVCNNSKQEQNFQMKDISEDVSVCSKSQCVSNERKNIDEKKPQVENSVKSSTEKVDKEECSYQEIDSTGSLNDHTCSKKKQNIGTNAQSSAVNTQKRDSKHELNTSRIGIDPSLLKQLKKAEGGIFYNIWPTKTNYECILCNKTLSGPKVIIEHVRGHYHQTRLAQLVNDTIGSQQHMDSANIKNNTISSASSETHSDTAVLEKMAQLRNVLRGVSHIEGSTDLYILHGKGSILCALCQCEIPPTIKNVSDHLLGGKHSKNKTELPAAQ